MVIDKFGQHIYSENDLVELYLTDPERKIKQVLVNKLINVSDIISVEDLPKFITYTTEKISVSEFDKNMQSFWFIPDEYKSLDIAKHILDLCKTDEELQRAGQELLMFQERDMFMLLRYLKYLVDTLRKNNIVWGVGRGSSVASYVLYLIGVHKINSLYYDISIEEFLK